MATSTQGWIKLHRKLLEWEWATKPLTFRLFIHILLNANLSSSTFRGQFIPAGSFVSGRIKLAQECGMTEREVRTALNHLRTTNEVTIKTTSEFSIISIVCWEKYQSTDQPIVQRSTSQSSNDRPQIKELKKKEDKKEEYSLSIERGESFKVSGGEFVNFDGLFERFWNIYPAIRAKGKKEIAKQQLKIKLSKGASYEEIGRGILNYKNYCERTGEKNKDMFRWIRDELYNEDYTLSIISNQGATQNVSRRPTRSELFDEATRQVFAEIDAGNIGQ